MPGSHSEQPACMCPHQHALPATLPSQARHPHTNTLSTHLVVLGLANVHQHLCRRVVHIHAFEDRGAVVGHRHLPPPAHALQDLVLRAAGNGRQRGSGVSGRWCGSTPASARAAGERRRRVAAGGRGGSAAGRAAGVGGAQGAVICCPATPRTMPLGPSVLLTRSAMAMAPTKLACSSRCGGSHDHRCQAPQQAGGSLYRPLGSPDGHSRPCLRERLVRAQTV